MSRRIETGIYTIENPAGNIVGYKVQVGKGGRRWYFTRQTLEAAKVCRGQAIADLAATPKPKDPYDRYEIAPRQRRGTLGDWIAQWRQGRRLTPRAAYNQDKMIDTHILPHLGHLVLDDDYTGDDRLTRLRVQRWVWTLEEAYSPWYVRGIHGVLRVALLDAVDEPGVPIAASPCVRIRMEPVEPTGRHALSPELVAAVCSRCVGPAERAPGRGYRGGRADYRVLAWTAAFTGMRVGELLARDVGDWSPFRGIQIASRPVAGSGRPRGEKRSRASKTPAGARVIQVCPSHGAMLRDYVGGRRDGPLFLNTLGRRPGYRAVASMVERAAERARADGFDVPEGFSIHWVRHGHETWLDEDECRPVAIDERMGHSTPGMRGVYTHPTDAMRAKILDALEARWRRAHGLPAAGTEAG